MAKTKAAWDDSFYVRAYQLAKCGNTNGQIATAFGITMKGFRKWREDKPALEAALKEARKPKDGLNFIYGRLSEKAQACWRRIMDLEKKTNSIQRIENLYGKYGEGIKKEIFLHVMAGSMFNPTKASRRCGIEYREYKKWIEEDFEFARLVEEMGEHRGAFYDEKFNELVNEKEPMIVLHAQKTYNRDKGFGDKTVVQHTGEVKNTHTLELSEKLLNLLSVACRRELMDAMETLQDQEKNTVPALGHKVLS